MKQNKGYNWSGHPVGETGSYYAYLARLRSIPKPATENQKKYQAFLCAVLTGNGLTPKRFCEGHNNRSSYSSAISKNVFMARANGIDISKEAQDEYWKGVSADGGE